MNAKTSIEVDSRGIKVVKDLHVKFKVLTSRCYRYSFVKQIETRYCRKRKLLI